MRPSHHPADDVLAAYASGGLKPGFDLVVAAHLEDCPTCRRGVRLFEDAAGHHLEAIPPAPLREDALDHALARLDRDPARTLPPSPPADRRRLVERLPLGRRRWIAPNVWVQPVKIDYDRKDRVDLLHAGPGLQTILHGHEGEEFTYVVYGALHDQGVTLRPGDFCVRDPDVVHAPQVAEGESCLCLVATEGRVVGKNWVARLVQTIAGV